MKRKIALILTILLIMTSVIRISPERSYAFISENMYDEDMLEDMANNSEIHEYSPDISPMTEDDLEDEIENDDNDDITLYFDTNGGEILDPYVLNKSDMIEELPTLNRLGYVFTGRFYEDNSKVELPMILEKNTTIFAKRDKEENILIRARDDLYNIDHLDDSYETSDISKINYSVFPESTFSFHKMARAQILLDNLNPVIGLNHPKTPGEVMLFKEAKPTPGKVNTWEITVRVEGKSRPTTSDIVLVIDRSGSMRDYGRMDAAKDAAYAFINKLLPSDLHRIGIVSFAFNASADQALTNDMYNLRYAIENLGPDGGTFTQAAIRQASALLNNSDANNKHIVLLSDGEPTFSYAIYNPNQFANQWVSNVVSSPGFYYRSGWATSSAIDEENFIYSYREGDGRSMRYAYESDSNNFFRFYNHGNSAIAEARFAGYKNYNVFTIGLQTNEIGSGVLRNMRQGIGSFTEVRDTEDLTDVFKQIAGQIDSPIRDAKVTDPLGIGFDILEKNILNITSSEGEVTYEDDKISRDIGSLSKPIYKGSDIYYAELKYTVEINDDIVDEIADKEGKYPTNRRTTLEYKDIDGIERMGDFPIPKVNPVLYRLSKELKDKDGKTIDIDKSFKIDITDPKGLHKELEINALKNHRSSRLRTDLREPGDYGFREKVSDEDYEVSYFVNDKETDNLSFNIPDNDTDDVDIKVVNRQKPGYLTIIKEFDKGQFEGNPHFDFKVIGPSGYEKIFSLPEDGTREKQLQDLSRGTYTVEELTKDYDTTVKLNDEEAIKTKSVKVSIEEGKLKNTVKVINKYVKTDLRIEKRNKKDESKIRGAEFTLYSTDENGEEGQISVTIKTDNNGRAEINGLTPGNYILRETRVPAGFKGEYDHLKIKISTDRKITVFTNDGKIVTPMKSADSKEYFVLYNIPTSSLPSTGGGGIGMYHLMGGVFILSSLIINNKKKNKINSFKGREK